MALTASGIALPYFAIYQGAALATLELVAAGTGSCAFQATAGVTYRLAASATSTTGYPFVLRLEQAGSGPPNDAFAGARVLDAQQVVAGTLAGASREVGEPWHDSNPVTETVWYRWTAPAIGRGRVTLRTGNPGALVIYRGSALTGLTAVVAATTEAGFAVSGGEELLILVGRGGSGIAGPFELSVGMTDTGSNDAFANRLELGSTTQTSWTGALETATIEPGETPYESFGNGSRWWTWTAPADGGVSLQLGGGRIVPVAYVYTGTSLGTLGLLATSGYASRLAFSVRAGTTYQIALRGKPATTGSGDFQASLLLLPQPNDAQERAFPLASALPVSAAATQAGATYLWWQWLAPTSGMVDIDFSGTAFSPNPAIWTGPGLPVLDSISLSRVNDEVRRFTAVAGTRYWIRTAMNQDTFFGAVTFELRAATTTPPPNDLFANAQLATGEGLAINTMNFGATDEPGEPLPQSRPYTLTFSKSLWWRWVAPRSGLLRVKITKGWAFLYEGPTWPALREVAWPAGGNSTSGVYWVVAGREYFLAAGNNVQGPVVATVELSPPGDSFADALDLGSGTWLTRSGSLAGCFWEPGEPLHHGTAPQATLWFRWQAPTSGSYRVVVRSGAASLRVAAYGGDGITALSQLGSGAGACCVTAAAGTAVRIAVDGGSAAGPYELLLEAELPGYGAWRDGWADPLDPASAPGADPDGDGRVNLLEFALGSEPLVASPGPGFTWDDSLGRIRLNVRRPIDRSAWDYGFDLSPALTGWLAGSQMNRIESVEDHGDGTETLHVVLPEYRYADHPTMFFRLRVAPKRALNSPNPDRAGGI